MKVQIRQGVFETNSSSTHAISIASIDNITIPEVIKFEHTGEFGWENNIINTIDEKANYFWTAACYLYSELKEKDILDNIKCKVTEILYNAGVKTVIFQGTNYKVSDWNPDFIYIESDGYVDHVSALSGWIDELIEEPDLLLGYLFNEDSQIHTGNDNSDEPILYNKNAIYTYYKGN